MAERGTSEPAGRDRPDESVARMLQAIYDLLRERSAWPAFRTVDLRFDRDLKIADAQAALQGVPAQYLQRGQLSADYHDTDEVRLTLLAVRECSGGPQDLGLLLRLIQWLCEIERAKDSSDDDDPTVTSTDFAAAIGLPVTQAELDATKSGPGSDADHAPAASARSVSVSPGKESAAATADPSGEDSGQIEQNRATLARLYALADLIVPRFWSGAGYPTQETRWRWRYTIDRRRLRPYRDVHNVDQLIDLVDRQRESLPHPQAAMKLLNQSEQPDSGQDSESEREPRVRRWRDNPWTVTVVGGFIVAVAGGVTVAELTSHSSPASKPKQVIALTIQNDRSYGVWTRSTPAGQFSPQTTKPANGIQWLPQGATIHARCARSGDRYHVVFNGVQQTWSWWIKLLSGQWIQSGGVAQTDFTGNGPVPHVPMC